MKAPLLFQLCIISVLVMNSCGLVNNLANNSGDSNFSGAPYDVIIVPGVPFDSGKVNPIYKARMLWAQYLFDRKIARNIIFSGGAVHTPYIEGQSMKIMADSMGIPSANTFVESRAEHSSENVDYGIQLARQLGFKKIAIATDPFQSHFIRRFLEKCRNNVALIPFPLQMMPLYQKDKVPQINASAAYVKDFVPLDKRETAQGN
ncbi:MAG TPA: YdcF family protein [Chitinophagales bacterium]|nr:YdcF family protein [Chitinophagales bacterium]